MKKFLSDAETQTLKEDIESIIHNPILLEDQKHHKSIFAVLRSLESGQLRVASPPDLGPNCGEVPMQNLETWIVHSWVKEAILFAMKIRQPKQVSIQTHNNQNENQQERKHLGEISYRDKFDLQTQFDTLQARALPGALVREGAYIASDTVIMPSFTNLGAWVGTKTMVDTWATVGSCAQIGKEVHIAGGVGIGGVLEPANARPILIGDKAFIGSRVILVEGVIVGEGAVLGANCCITLSSPVYDVTGTNKIEYRGIIPPHAVVVPGTRTRTFPGGEVSLDCCYIIDYRGEKQNNKLQLNEVLRSSPKTNTFVQKDL